MTKLSTHTMGNCGEQMLSGWKLTGYWEWHLPSQLTTLNTVSVQVASAKRHHVTLGSAQKSSERRRDSKGSTSSMQGRGIVHQQCQEDAEIHTGLLYITQVLNR